MFKRLPFILLIAALALGPFFVAMWVWQPRMLPHHLAHSAHKAPRGALEMRGLSAPEDEDESVEAARRDALENAPHDGSNEKNTAGLLECDRSEAAEKLRRTLRKGKFERLRCLAARVASHEASAKRIEFIAADRLDDPVLVGGGIGMFLEHCPPSPHSGLPGGCLAVEYSRTGEVSRAVPFRMQAIDGANIFPEDDLDDEYFRRRAATLQSSWPLVIVNSVSPYPGGDLLVQLETRPSPGMPFYHSAGSARVAQDGQPHWFRKDYSSFWPHIIDDNLALVLNRRVGLSGAADALIAARLGAAKQQRTKTLQVNDKEKPTECHGWKCKWQIDTINLIDGRGRLLDTIDTLDALLESSYNSIFFDSKLYMWRENPVWIASIHQLGADVSGANNIAPGDIVVSFPDLDAFGIIGQNDRRLKQLVRGDFSQQHAVRHLEKARFLMFDWGKASSTSLRLLMFDLTTGKQTILFPRDHTPAHLRLVVADNRRHLPRRIMADRHLALSPNRRRVLFGEPRTGLAFELRLSDGRVLNIFRQLHDLSSVDGVPEPLRQRAWVFRTSSYEYM